MIIGVMCIERIRVAFVAIVDDILVSIREQPSYRERWREDRATSRRDAQPPFSLRWGSRQLLSPSRRSSDRTSFSSDWRGVISLSCGL